MPSILLLTLVLATPLILAALGGFASERSGVINIGLEGMMLAAACAAGIFGFKAGPVAGLAAGVGIATVLSLLHWVATQHFRMDHVISGISINALAAGGTNFAWEKFSEAGLQGKAPAFPMPFYIAVAVLFPFAVWLFVAKTRGGLRLMAVGSDPEKARMVGVQPVQVRFWALLATGVFTGLGGAALVADTGIFTDNMTAGRGYIALAALILAGWRPLPAFGACLAFAFLSALRLQLEGTKTLGIDVPTEAWQMLPYLATVIALAGFMGRRRPPAGLGKM